MSGGKKGQNRAPSKKREPTSYSDKYKDKIIIRSCADDGVTNAEICKRETEKGRCLPESTLRAWLNSPRAREIQLVRDILAFPADDAKLDAGPDVQKKAKTSEVTEEFEDYNNNYEIRSADTKDVDHLPEDKTMSKSPFDWLLEVSKRTYEKEVLVANTLKGC